MSARILAVGLTPTLLAQLRRAVDSARDMELAADCDVARAREHVRKLDPDAVVLELTAAGGSDIEFLSWLTRMYALPVVVTVSAAVRAQDVVPLAMRLGAAGALTGMLHSDHDMLERIRGAMITRPKQQMAVHVPPSHSADAILPRKSVALPLGAAKLLIVGASTGGTEAVKEFLSGLTPQAPGVLVVQHMPEMFTRSFAARLNGVCKIAVCEAEQGQRILPGHAYIAPGHSHLLINVVGGQYFIELSQGPAVNRHRPAVDVLFRSAANCLGANGVGVILTGMGKDGAVGMREMREAGAYTLAQDESSCVVFGMPKEAIALGGVQEVVPLAQMASRAMLALQRAPVV